MRSRGSRARAWIIEPIGLEVRNLPKPVSGKGLFGNEHPVEMEIGAGKGAFLVEEAKNRPAVNFIGIERARRYWGLASDRVRCHGCSNVRLILVDAYYFLDAFVPDDFPECHLRPLSRPVAEEASSKAPFDPTEGSCKSVARVLTPGGRFQAVTDHKDYFDHMVGAVGSSSLLQSEYRPPSTAAAGELVGSNFEKKYRLEGRTSYALAGGEGKPALTNSEARLGPFQLDWQRPVADLRGWTRP